MSKCKAVLDSQKVTKITVKKKDEKTKEVAREAVASQEALKIVAVSQ
ncbi:MAG: hypothetical protein M0Q92_08855 [Methanoregula sp.]|jgi:hypothetical protein|nr:hypothetical protein [Methanoregula sp.]